MLPPHSRTKGKPFTHVQYMVVEYMIILRTCKRTSGCRGNVKLVQLGYSSQLCDLFSSASQGTCRCYKVEMYLWLPVLPSVPQPWQMHTTVLNRPIFLVGNHCLPLAITETFVLAREKMVIQHSLFSNILQCSSTQTLSPCQMSQQFLRVAMPI